MSPEKKAPEPRRTLAQYGRRGDRVRVLDDKHAGRVVVHYRDLAGIARKKLFDRTKDGRAEAVAWAESYHAERDAEAKRRAQPAAPETTHRALWDAYTASPAYTDLRDASRVSYAQLWRTWERFRGRDARVDDTTLHHVDLFRAEMQRLERASNQARQVLNVARTVMKWGQSRKLVTVNELALFKWKTPKGQEAMEPDEYTGSEYGKILAELNPQDGARWRGHVAFMLAGHHGQRARAIRLLTVTDARAALETGEIVWRADIMKAGKDHPQPLTPEGRAALLTALDWRARLRYTGPWLLFAGGGNKRLSNGGLVRKAGARVPERRPDEDAPVTYQGLWRALKGAEDRAKVTHRDRRALHGFRKMAAGNVADATGDARLGMEWIGDTSPAMQKKYLRRRDARLDRAADAAGTASAPALAKRAAKKNARAAGVTPAAQLSRAQRDARKVSANRPDAPNDKTVRLTTTSAPAGTGAPTADTSTTYEAAHVND